MHIKKSGFFLSAAIIGSLFFAKAALAQQIDYVSVNVLGAYAVEEQDDRKMIKVVSTENPDSVMIVEARSASIGVSLHDFVQEFTLSNSLTEFEEMDENSYMARGVCKDAPCAYLIKQKEESDAGRSLLVVSMMNPDQIMYEMAATAEVLQ